MGMLTAEALLAGTALNHEVNIPPDLLRSKGDSSSPQQVVLRPLTVRALQRITKAARDDDGLSATLMIKEALVEPQLVAEQIAQLPAGLARFLVEQINTLSGISTPRNELEEVVQAPLAKACFVLAKEFGWTPEEVSGMTIGQILLYLEMVRSERQRP
jgi:hypothetical protein